MNILRHLILTMLLFYSMGFMTICIAQDTGSIMTGQFSSGATGWATQIEIEPTEEENSNENTAASNWNFQPDAANTDKAIKYSYAGGVGTGMVMDGKQYSYQLLEKLGEIARSIKNGNVEFSYEGPKTLKELTRAFGVSGTVNSKIKLGNPTIIPEEFMFSGMDKEQLFALLLDIPEELLFAGMNKEQLFDILLGVEDFVKSYKDLLGMSLMEFFSVLYETDCWVSLNEFHRYKARRKQAEEASKGHGSLDDYGRKSDEDK